VLFPENPGKERKNHIDVLGTKQVSQTKRGGELGARCRWGQHSSAYVVDWGEEEREGGDDAAT